MYTSLIQVLRSLKGDLVFSSTGSTLSIAGAPPSRAVAEALSLKMAIAGANARWRPSAGAGREGVESG
jgi:hypothetical protein